MKKKKISFFLTALSGIVVGVYLTQLPFSQHLLTTVFKTPYLPSSCPIMHRKAYTFAYDGRLKSASWVYEKLTTSSLEGHVDRAHFDFMEDPLIPKILRATKADYKKSGFDRGHLCPAADAKATTQAMEETFYLSNISPQHPKLNRHYWIKLEKHARELTQSHDQVYVITGPLFLAETATDGRRYVRYEVIGANEVAVPTHYFKVLKTVKEGIVNTEAYIIPNRPIGPNQPLQEFAVNLEKIEKAAGLLLVSKGPN